MWQTPAGDSRDRSEPRRYRIDPVRMVATEVWSFSHLPKISSSICSSVYQEGSSYLIDYPHGADGKLHFVGLGKGDAVAFDYQYDGQCWNGWNTKIIRLSALTFK